MNNHTQYVQLQRGVFHGFDEEQILEAPETWRVEDFNDIVERYRLWPRLNALGEGAYELMPQ